MTDDVVPPEMTTCDLCGEETPVPPRRTHPGQNPAVVFCPKCSDGLGA